MKTTTFLAMLCVVAAASACNSTRNERPAASQTVGTGGEVDLNKASSSDRDFVQNVLIDGTTEVELGKLANERGSSPDVKRFGKMMADDHSKADDQLKRIAS